jgi:hypothetical protein
MSVFRASNHSTYPVPQPRPPYDEAFDGPTERLYESDKDVEPPPPRSPRRYGLPVALTVAVLALIASAGASMIAWRALGVARAAADSRLPASFAALPPPPAVTPSAVAPSIAPTPSVTYSVAYDKEALTAQVACADATYLDLDEPLADAEQAKADLRYDNRCGDGASTLSLGPGASAGSEVTGADVDAEACREAITATPLAPDAEVEIKSGVQLCVLTSGVGTANPDPAGRMVLVEVTEMDVDGTAGLRATSWSSGE